MTHWKQPRLCWFRYEALPELKFILDLNGTINQINNSTRALHEIAWISHEGSDSLCGPKKTESKVPKKTESKVSNDIKQINNSTRILYKN